MLILQPCKCLKCGKVYFHFSGGIILKIESPKCPDCGSRLFVPSSMTKNSK